MFPSSLCSAAVTIINLLDDPQVSIEGSAVYEVAYKVIWHCLVEDSALFLRHFLERLTREKQSAIFQILRRLIRFMPRLPAQAAFTLYNYMIGFVMYHVRAPIENSQEIIATVLVYIMVGSAKCAWTLPQRSQTSVAKRAVRRLLF